MTSDKYTKLLSDARKVVDIIDRSFCTCDHRYRDLGRSDPDCRAHDIATFLRVFLDAQEQADNEPHN